MSRSAHFYILTNPYKTGLYSGVTSGLYERVSAHTQRAGATFPSIYNCNELVSYEEFDRIDDAIAREKQVKRWKRA